MVNAVPRNSLYLVYYLLIQTANCVQLTLFQRNVNAISCYVNLLWFSAHKFCNKTDKNDINVVPVIGKVNHGVCKLVVHPLQVSDTPLSA